MADRNGLLRCSHDGQEPDRGGQRHGTIHRRTDEQPRPADVLVVFGISGDLAKVMTFRSLYRLERGLLTCLVVGVAVNDWTDESCASTPARRSRPPASRWTRRCSGASPGACPISPATSATRRPSSASAPPSARRRPRCSTWRSRRSCSGPVIKGLADAGLTKGARVVVEKPFGHDLRRRAPSTTRSTPTSTSRSCSGSTTSWARWAWTRSCTCASPTPCWSRSGTASTWRSWRSPWPRASGSRTAATSMTWWARSGTWSSTT